MCSILLSNQIRLVVSKTVQSLEGVVVPMEFVEKFLLGIQNSYLYLQRIQKFLGRGPCVLFSVIRDCFLFKYPPFSTTVLGWSLSIVKQGNPDQLLLYTLKNLSDFELAIPC